MVEREAQVKGTSYEAGGLLVSVWGQLADCSGSARMSLCPEALSKLIAADSVTCGPALMHRNGVEHPKTPGGRWIVEQEVAWLCLEGKSEGYAG